MNWDVALLKSDKRILLKSFSDHQENPVKWLEFDEIEKICPATLFYSQESLTDEIKDTLATQARFFPIRKAEDFKLNPENFESLKFADIKEGLLQSSASWILNNNLSLLEELIKVMTHLKALWPNDRTSFFEELWFILKINLNASDFKVIFNDIDKSNGDTKEKQKLIRVQIEGIKSPNPVPGNDFSDTLMDTFKNEFTSNFRIVEYDQSKSELTMACQINKSPVLIMGKVPQLTQLQVALFQAFFDGLQQEV